MIYLFRVSFGVHLPKAALRSNANIANRIPKICDERVSVAPTLRRHSGWNVHVVWRPSVVNECSSRHDKHGAHATRSSIRHQSFSRAVAAAAHIFHNVNGATVKRKPEATHTHTHELRARRAHRTWYASTRVIIYDLKLVSLLIIVQSFRKWRVKTLVNVN